MDRISKALAKAKETRRFTPEPTDRARGVSHGVESTFLGAMHVDVPHDFLRTMKILAASDHDRYADAYNLLRTRVLRTMEERRWVALGITSPQPRAGKSLTAVNLALAIARNPKYSALLIDADLRNPSIHRLFGIEPEKGLVEYLSSDEPLNAYLVCPGIERFAILPTVAKVSGSSTLIGSNRVKQLIEGFRTRVGTMVAIFDLPPLLIGDDAVALSSLLDAVLVVVEDGVTKTADLKRAMELLQHAEVLGSVLNKSRHSQTKDYDYYS